MTAIQNFSEPKTLKRIAALVVAAGVLTAGSASAMTAGTYTSTVQGRNGNITVEVKVSATKIESVRVTDQKETPGIGSLAVKSIPEAVVAGQTAQVDNVSGASITSQALRKGIREALVKAGADRAMLDRKAIRKQSAAAQTLVHSADVIVVGGGGAGMVAAATAVDGGAKVIVLEKMAMIGGNTARSEGNMSAMDPEPEKLLPMTPAVRDIVKKYTDQKPCTKEVAELQKTVKDQLKAHDAAGKKYIFDSPELFALQTLEGGDCHNDPKLVLTMTRNATAAMEWLEKQSDMKWYHVPRHWVDVGIGGIYPRGQWPRQADGKTPISTYDAYISPLADKVTKAGGHIYTQMKVTQIVRPYSIAGGLYDALKATDGENQAFNGKNVILAAGGYGANLKMVKKYNNINVIATSNQPGTTGEVLEEAVKVGAGLTGMKWIQIHPHGNPKNGELESAIAGRPSDTPYVNVNGDRFVDETGRRDDISHGILAQPGQVVYAIFDQKTIDQKKVRDDLMQIALGHGYAYKADTLSDLAKAAGINQAEFAKTMAAYNEASRTQNTKSLPVPKILIGMPVDKAPFYSVPITTTIHHTMGGLRINEKTQVLDEKGRVIPGLYAAGEITGGIHGGNRLGRNALTDLLVFGHIAGMQVSPKP